MCNEAVIARYQKALNELQKSFTADMGDIEKQGKLKIVVSKLKNSIDYVPSTRDECLIYMQQIVAEMELRNKCTANKTLGQMRNEIKESLIAEKYESSD